MSASASPSVDKVARKRGPKANASKARILEAAAKIFGELGYAGTTLRAVAQAAGIEAGSIYYHYKSKDELIEAVLMHGLADAMQSVSDAIAGLPETATATARLRAAVGAHLASVLMLGSFTLASRRVLGQVPARVHARHLARQARYGRMLTALIQQGIDSGKFRREIDARRACLFILGGVNWVVEWRRDDRDSIASLTEEFADYVLHGLSAAAPAVA